MSNLVRNFKGVVVSVNRFDNENGGYISVKIANYDEQRMETHNFMLGKDAKERSLVSIRIWLNNLYLNNPLITDPETNKPFTELKLRDPEFLAFVEGMEMDSAYDIVIDDAFKLLEQTVTELVLPFHVVYNEGTTKAGVSRTFRNINPWKYEAPVVEEPQVEQLESKEFELI